LALTLAALFAIFRFGLPMLAVLLAASVAGVAGTVFVGAL
jgi:hypothetical protein